MSAVPMDGGLYAVPAPPQRERFSLLLRLRRAARQAFDTMLALPRSAAGWVLRQARMVLSALGSNPFLNRLGTRLAGLADVIRAVGPVTVTAAVLSIPSVWNTTVRAAQWFGSKIAAGASALWRHTHSLLAKCGPTGTRIATGLATAGGACRRLFVTVCGHPATQALVRGVASLAVLVRPVTHSTVVHRLLGRLVGASWLRWSLELLILPFVMAPNLVADLSGGLRTAAASPARPSSPPARGASAFVVPPETSGSEASEDHEPVGPDDWTAAFQPSNRAERRAQQQARAHAKRDRAQR